MFAFEFFITARLLEISLPVPQVGQTTTTLTRIPPIIAPTAWAFRNGRPFSMPLNSEERSDAFYCTLHGWNGAFGQLVMLWEKQFSHYKAGADIRMVQQLPFLSSSWNISHCVCRCPSAQTNDHAHFGRFTWKKGWCDNASVCLKRGERQGWPAHDLSWPHHSE